MPFYIAQVSIIWVIEYWVIFDFKLRLNQVDLVLTISNVLDNVHNVEFTFLSLLALFDNVMVLFVPF